MSVVPTPMTTEMQQLWNRAMLLTRTRGAYGLAFPVPGTNYDPPCEGSMLRDILFVCTASDEEYEAFLQTVREDMIAWKARVAASSGKNKLSMVRSAPVSLKGIDLEKVEFKL